MTGTSESGGHCSLNPTEEIGPLVNSEEGIKTLRSWMSGRYQSFPQPKFVENVIRLIARGFFVGIVLFSW